MLTISEVPGFAIGVAASEVLRGKKLLSVVNYGHTSGGSYISSNLEF